MQPSASGAGGSVDRQSSGPTAQVGSAGLARSRPMPASSNSAAVFTRRPPDRKDRESWRLKKPMTGCTSSPV
ncbi:UDP-glycosyltransferase 92A1-like [Iris pallida]|uniref:UDP-glycosyltransferase 92A1-like n=1 Tax=Iris pallida TaxID=29817 RepID=A0AAX6I477_IRIPA|nr:UDP-glycosyltransferase 92A1-like [Iris pallida]